MRKFIMPSLAYHLLLDYFSQVPIQSSDYACQLLSLKIQNNSFWICQVFPIFGFKCKADGCWVDQGFDTISGIQFSLPAYLQQELF